MNLQQMHTVHVPRRLKYGIAVAYIFIVILGSYFGRQNYTGSEGTHYFASRRNLLNQLFVKRGWMWFTIVFWASYAGRSIKCRYSAALLRYSVATLWWILFAQWFLGPPLMDRVFMLTGGTCLIDVPTKTNIGAQNSGILSLHTPGASIAIDAVKRNTSPGIGDVATSATCRSHGGIWLGGHDPSGHVFLLVFTSLSLWMDIIPELIYHRRNGTKYDWAVKVPLVLLGMWAFMLLMTSMYFHSFAEKTTGLLFAFAEFYVVYILSETSRWGKYFDTEAHETAESTELEGNEDFTLESTSDI